MRLRQLSIQRRLLAKIAVAAVAVGGVGMAFAPVANAYIGEHNFTGSGVNIHKGYPQSSTFGTIIGSGFPNQTFGINSFIGECQNAAWNVNGDHVWDEGNDITTGVDNGVVSDWYLGQIFDLC